MEQSVLELVQYYHNPYLYLNLTAYNSQSTIISDEDFEVLSCLRRKEISAFALYRSNIYQNFNASSNVFFRPPKLRISKQNWFDSVLPWRVSDSLKIGLVFRSYYE